MVGFLAGLHFRELKISPQLSRVLQTTCLNCYNQFDQGNHRPYMIGPCQHHYCAKCIDQVIFNREDEANCPQCEKKVTKSLLRRNKHLEKVVQIQNTFNSPEKSSLRQIQQDLARKLFQSFSFFCPSCEEMFNINEKRRPVMICQAQHILCQKCLGGKLRGEKNCKVCRAPMLDKENLNFFKLYQLMLEFINISMFNRKVTFEVGERKFNLAVDEETTIKQIFHLLQEYELISRQLEIKQCSFHHVVETENYQIEEREVDFTASIRMITRQDALTISMDFALGALKKGTKVTMASKIVKKLPIKISDFQPEQRFRREEQQDRFSHFGPIEDKKQQDPSWISKRASTIKGQSQKEIQKPLYPNLEQKPRSRIQNFQKQFYPNLELEKAKIQKPQISASKLKLVEESNRRANELEKKRFEISQIKRSRIPKRQEMKIGTEIPEEMMENISTKALNGNPRQQILDNFVRNHIINEQDEAFVCFKTEKIINKPFTKEEQAASAILFNQIQAEANKGDTLSVLLTILKQEIEDGDIRVIFSPKSTQRSKMSLKIITSHFISDRIIIKETFDEDENYYFEKLYKSQDELAGFLAKQKKKLSTKFGISEQSIVFHRLIKGSLILYASTHEGQELARSIKHNLDRNVEIEPFIKQLELSPEDFDKQGYIKFGSNKSDIQFRGNWPYYQPINATRFGIKVKGLFDQGDNKWLKMKNQVGQWAVGFHEVRNPNASYKNYKNIIESIIGSRSQPKIRVQYQEISYEEQKCANKEEKMGRGVMLTPSFERVLNKTEEVRVGDKIYHLVFQCRLKPDEIKISSRNNSKWLVSRSSAIRPYGIVIIENGARLAYPTLEEEFGKNFVYSDYKSKIEAHKLA